MINTPVGSNSYSCNGIHIYGGNVRVGGETMPRCPAANLCNTSIIDGHVFIGGYELVHGEWKKTLRAFWHKVF